MIKKILQFGKHNLCIRRSLLLQLWRGSCVVSVFQQWLIVWKQTYRSDLLKYIQEGRHFITGQSEHVREHCHRLPTVQIVPPPYSALIYHPYFAPFKTRNVPISDWNYVYYLELTFGVIYRAQECGNISRKLHHLTTWPPVMMCISCSYVKLIEPRTLRYRMYARRKRISAIG